MNIIKVLAVIILGFFFLSSCEKAKSDKTELNVEFNIIEVISFTDSLMVAFNIEVTNGFSPYSYEWESPDSLINNGPFSIILKSDFEFKLSVKDSKGNLKTENLTFETNSYLSDTTYDYRNKYVGSYLFTIIDKSYWMGEEDSIKYSFEGQIEKYSKNRLLIKYSSNSIQCDCETSENSMCGGPLESDCVQNCSVDKLFFVKNWVNPIVYDNDSLSLFDGYTMSKAYATGKFKSDSVTLKLNYMEKDYGYHHIIEGIKQK